jgi:hypothetical protein
MFCFSVSYTWHTLPAIKIYTSAGAGRESVKTEEQSSPIAWAEPSTSHTIAGAEESSIEVYTLSLGLLQPALDYSSLKPGKVILSFIAAITRYLLQPNAP